MPLWSELDRTELWALAPDQACSAHSGEPPVESRQMDNCQTCFSNGECCRSRSLQPVRRALYRPVLFRAFKCSFSLEKWKLAAVAFSNCQQVKVFVSIWIWMFELFFRLCYPSLVPASNGESSAGCTGPRRALSCRWASCVDKKWLRSFKTTIKRFMSSRLPVVRVRLDFSESRWLSNFEIKLWSTRRASLVRHCLKSGNQPYFTQRSHQVWSAFGLAKVKGCQRRDVQAGVLQTKKWSDAGHLAADNLMFWLRTSEKLF